MLQQPIAVVVIHDSELVVNVLPLPRLVIHAVKLRDARPAAPNPNLRRR